MQGAFIPVLLLRTFYSKGLFRINSRGDIDAKIGSSLTISHVRIIVKVDNRVNIFRSVASQK